MPYQANVIVQALAPGMALTSMIFYYGNLQQRMIFTVETIRRLNAEARSVHSERPSGWQARMANIDWQVTDLANRFNSVHRAILFVYAGFFCSILTILGLLFIGFSDSSTLIAIPYATFAIGFICMAIATLVSAGELTLARSTILADIQGSFPDSRLPLPEEAADGQARVRPHLPSA